MKNISALPVFLVSRVKAAFAAVSRTLDFDLAERRARDAYLSGSTSIQELEARDRAWDRSQGMHSNFMNGIR